MTYQTKKNAAFFYKDRKRKKRKFRSFINIYIYIEKKNRTFRVLLQKNETFSRSFTFFAKECCILGVLLRSLQKNTAFFAFFYVLSKRTLRSLRSFLFFRKERKRTERSFGSHKSPKTRKKNGKEQNVL